MCSTPGCKYAATQKDRDIGWRLDSYGNVQIVTDSKNVPPNANFNHMYDRYPKAITQCGVQEAWKRAPVVLETSGTVGRWYDRGYDIDFILDWGLRNHASVFMPKSCYIPDEWREKIEAFSRRLGYRFVLRQVTMPLEARSGEAVSFEVYLDNVGCAPIYRRYRLALRFKQQDIVEIIPFKEDVRSWLPGFKWFSESPPLPKTLRPGVVKIDIAILHPERDEPAVKFAIKGVQPDGWYPLRYMDVLQ